LVGVIAAAFPAGSSIDRVGQKSPGGAENRIGLLRENAPACASFDHVIIQGEVGVWAFRGIEHWRLLGGMLPGAVVGIALGHGFAASVSPHAVMAFVGTISILFGT